ncbi:MAG: YdcF family protein [Armatimonadetes bacterium]|nr:YdcF family protein [Armatimonadota bacterium]
MAGESLRWKASVTKPDVVGSANQRWWFLLAAVAEFGAMLLMTRIRYTTQRIQPQLFDFTREANVYGFFVALPFVLLFLVLACVPHLHRRGLAATAVGVSVAALAALVAAPLLSVAAQPYLFGGYLGVKAFALALFVVWLRPAAQGRWAVWRKSLLVFLLGLGIMGGVLITVIVMILTSPIGPQVDEAPRQQYDAGVILGAAVWSGNRPSPVLRQRVNRGYDLLNDGVVQFLVVTGGSAPNELPEAEVARRELLKLGVDPSRIVMEARTNSTVEQILYIRDQLMQKQRWSTFIIISDQFHLKRALEICAFNGINARGVSSESPLGPQNLVLYHVRESLALILYWMFGT